ncbi:hypothetical protein J3E69DRAFT_275173 [Trichoderma sp. SZMC 28015]
MQTTDTSTTATRVNLGPLTTVFSPPSDCTSLRFIAETEVFIGASIGYGCLDVQTQWTPCFPHPSGASDCSSAHGGSTTWLPCSTGATCPDYYSVARLGFSLVQSCYPSKFASSYGLTDYHTGQWISQPPVYSPGLACPSGYLPQCTVERGGGLSNPYATNTMASAYNSIWSMLNDDEIAIGCCPSNYACDSNFPHICTSQPHAGSVIKVTDGISCDGAGAMTMDWSLSTALTAQAMKILLIQSSTPTSASPSGETQSTKETQFPKETQPPKETQLPKDRFGKGAKIAVGLIVPIVVFLIAVALIFLLRRRRRRQLNPDREIAAGKDDSNTEVKAKVQGSTSTSILRPNGTTFEKPRLDDRQFGIPATPAELSNTIGANPMARYL